MSRVFVVEPPSVDISGARQWGEIVILFPQGMQRSPTDCEFYAGSVIARLEELKYDKTEDFICIVGSMTSMAVLTAAFVGRFRAFRCLIFNAVRESYMVKSLGRWRYIDKEY